MQRNSFPRVCGMCIYVKSGFCATRFKNFECGCHETMVIKIISRFNNFYISSLYRNPNSDIFIYDCLLSKMAHIQSTDRKSSFIFVGDLNAHHREWLCSVSPTNNHGHAAYDFTSLSGCGKLVAGTTHKSGNRLDLVLTNVPRIIEVNVFPPVVSSDHCLLCCRVSTFTQIPNVSVNRHVFLKSRAD